MLFENQSKIFFDLTRCCQCGACLAACSTSALTRIWLKNGLFEIIIDQQACSLCKKCLDVCPAAELPQHVLKELDWEKITAVYLGYSTDEAVRHSASSGGVCRSLIRNAIQNSYCDHAYCVVDTEQYPWAAGGFIGNTTTIANSKYLPIPVLENLKKSISGRLLIVGTHCQLLAAEKFYAKLSMLSLIKVCLLCKQQKTFEFTRFVVRRMGVRRQLNTPVAYRGNGWPGFVRINSQKLAWEQAAALAYGKKLWLVPGCWYCANPIGSNADITLADPWKISGNFGSGMTLVMARTNVGDKFLKSCGQGLQFNEINPMLAMESADWKNIQKSQKKTQYLTGENSSLLTDIHYRFADFQKSLYETILSRIKLPNLLLKIINRIPYLQ